MHAKLGHVSQQVRKNKKARSWLLRRSVAVFSFATGSWDCCIWCSIHILIPLKAAILFQVHMLFNWNDKRILFFLLFHFSSVHCVYFICISYIIVAVELFMVVAVDFLCHVTFGLELCDYMSFFPFVSSYPILSRQLHLYANCTRILFIVWFYLFQFFLCFI